MEIPHHIIAIINPKSRNGKAAALIPHLERAIAEREYPYTVLDLTTGTFDADLIQLIHQHSNARILAIGGDGTQHSMINLLVHLREKGKIKIIPPYCCAPTGTGNDIAKSLGIKPIKKEFTDVVNTLISGKPFAYDLGCLDGRYFADMVSCGMDATILDVRERLSARVQKHPLLNKLLHGYIIYAIAGVKSFFSLSKYKLTCTLPNNQKFSRNIVGALINNCPIHAGMFCLTPEAKMDDGYLNLKIFTNKLTYTLSFLRGWHFFPRSFASHSYTFKISEIKLEFLKEIPLQIDGELIDSASELNIHVCKKTINMIVPKTFH